MEELLREGVSLRQAQRDADALPVFLRAYGLSRVPLTAAQLGLVEQALGRWAQANVHLREALAAAEDPWIQRNRQTLERALAVNLEHIGTVELSGGVPGAELRLDGRVVGQLPLTEALTLEAGMVTLEVELAGYYPLRRELRVLAGQTTRQSIELQPLREAPRALPVVAPAVSAAEPATPTPTPTPAESPRERPSWQRPLSVGLLAGGGLVLVGGIVSLGLREQQAQAFNSNPACPRATWMSSPDCVALRSNGDLTLGFGVGGAALGAVGLVAGLVLWFLPPARARSAASALCVPQLDGAACALRF